MFNTTPFSSPSSTINAGLQPFKYNNKELDMMHGLNTYDYGARQYYPLLPMWDRVDPLADDNPGVSPYMYCAGDPVNKFDPDGRECGPGDKFDKLDDAAKDFGKCYNETSIENDKEMSTSFYKTTSLVSSGMPKDPNDPIKVEDAMKFYQ